MNGTHTKLDDGRHEIRFERRLNHSIDRVWAAITAPDEVEAWLARADLELRPGGRVRLQWLNTDDAQGDQHEEGVVANGTITAIEPPRLLELDTDRHGRMTWELRPDGDATDLALTVVIAMPDDYVVENLSGWHVHLEFLADWLDDGTRVDWPHWPRDRWEAARERYAASMRPIS
jgi:uncharacterized protein YndB with AHSA1/START domain